MSGSPDITEYLPTFLFEYKQSFQYSKIKRQADWCIWTERNNKGARGTPTNISHIDSSATQWHDILVDLLGFALNIHPELEFCHILSTDINAHYLVPSWDVHWSVQQSSIWGADGTTGSSSEKRLHWQGRKPLVDPFLFLPSRAIHACRINKVQYVYIFWYPRVKATVPKHGNPHPWIEWIFGFHGISTFLFCSVLLCPGRYFSVHRTELIMG